MVSEIRVDIRQLLISTILPDEQVESDKMVEIAERRAAQRARAAEEAAAAKQRVAKLLTRVVEATQLQTWASPA